MDTVKGATQNQPKRYFKKLYNLENERIATWDREDRRS